MQESRVIEFSTEFSKVDELIKYKVHNLRLQQKELWILLIMVL